MLPAYISPFWLDWKLIIVALIIYYLQIWILGGCILTYAQYGRWDETFSGRSIVLMASKIGWKIELCAVKRFLDVLPFIFIILAIIYQVILHGPLLITVEDSYGL
jgi:hypothetical protein